MNYKKRDWNEQEEQSLLKLKAKKLSYIEISEIMERNPDSLRKKFWLLNQANKTNFEKHAKALLLDIETSLMIFSAWRTGTQYLGATNILSDYFMISWSAKWLGGEEVYGDCLTPREAKKKNDKRLCEQIWKFLDEADVVITHNGDYFDLKKLNTRFIYNGIQLPRQYKSIDTLKLAKKVFNFSSNKLDYICQFLGLAGKTEHEGYEMWLECLKGNREALEAMLIYNRNDVLILENLYNYLKDGLYSGVKPPKTGWKEDKDD